jgi:acyl-CoA synthetase (AMP-forming)/AMP-acid ligase II
VHPETAVLLTTSGTTGSRKFVRLSASNVEANARSIAQYLELDPGERPVTSLPVHYSFGLSVLNSHWFAGACVVLTDDSVVQPSFWEAFRSYGCTSIAGVPFSYQLLERLGFREMDLPSLHTMQQAGGALDRRLTEVYARFMADRGGRLFVMYGQTEATARIAYVPPDRLPEKLGSAGIAIPGGRLEIDPATVEQRDGTAIGEVIYRGPNVMMGYASSPEDLELGDELHGVLRTGDLGYLDADGFLFLVGRSKRIGKVFGHRINLDEVEVRLREHGPAAVVGGPDSIWGFCEFGTEESVAALAASLARDLRLHHSAVKLRRVDVIPRSASGKIDYRAVEAWLNG